MAKVNEELLTKVKDAQSQIQEIQMTLGGIALAELSKVDLFAKYKELQIQINEATETIKSTLGDGVVDLNTGEFTASEKQEVPAPMHIEQ